MSFGLNDRRTLTGAGLYSHILRVSPLLPAVYVFLAAGYPAVITQKGLFSFLCELGLSALPRVETLLLSLLYRLSAREMAVYFTMLLLALAFGLVTDRLFRHSEKAGRTARLVLAGFVALDLLLRLLPLPFNRSFGLPCAILGFLIRLGCLVLILLDLRADKKAKS